MNHDTDLYAVYKAAPLLTHRLRRFIKERGIELTIAIVGLFIGIATVSVTYKVGQHQEILQASRMTDAYFNGISELFAKTTDENPRTDLVIIARTDAILEDLHRLNKPEKLASVVIFISHLQPNLLYPHQNGSNFRPNFIELQGFKFAGNALDNINLSKAKLNQSDLSDCDLQSSIFDSANMQDVQLQRSILKNASFRNTDLRNANLQGAIIYQTYFDNANLENAIWINGIRCKEGSIGYCKLT